MYKPTDPHLDIQYNLQWIADSSRLLPLVERHIPEVSPLWGVQFKFELMTLSFQRTTNLIVVLILF